MFFAIGHGLPRPATAAIPLRFHHRPPLLLCLGRYASTTQLLSCLYADFRRIQEFVVSVLYDKPDCPCAGVAFGPPLRRKPEYVGVLIENLRTLSIQPPIDRSLDAGQFRCTRG